MSKDFWERLNKLEELAEKATSPDWDIHVKDDNAYATNVDFHQADNLRYIAAVNPAMIMEMIDELKRLDDENYNLKCELSLADEDAYNMEQDCKSLEKEADCLATFLADICDYVADTDCCPVAEACVCPRDKCKDANKPEIWREKASELVELRTEADNA